MATDDFRELEKFFEELPSKLKEIYSKTLEKSTAHLLEKLNNIFQSEGKSHDVDWSPLKEAYLKWKVKKGFSEKKLHKTTSLAQSFSSVFTNQEAIVGTPIFYAPFHEYGTKRGIPPRPFMTPVFQKFIKEGIPAKLFSEAFNEVFK